MSRGSLFVKIEIERGRIRIPHTVTSWRSGRRETLSILIRPALVVEVEFFLIRIRGSPNGRLRATSICRERRQERERVRTKRLSVNLL
jgi:hypothetical protein